MRTDLLVLDEPPLSFRFDQQLVDPRDGLSLFGPVDHDTPAHPKSIRHVAVGTAQGLEQLRRWIAAMPRAWTQAPKDRTRIWPIYPGFETAFGAVLDSNPIRAHVLEQTGLDEASRIADPHRRASEVVAPYLAAIEAAASLDESVQLVICVVPDDIHARCRAKSIVPEAIGQRVTKTDRKRRGSGQLDLYEKYDPEMYRLSVDFRRQLKARAMTYGIPVQIIRESTLKLNDDVGLGERRLSPLSHRMWNLSTAIYYKAGGKPWKLSSARDGVCYIGMAFRLNDDVKARTTACCAAQLFLNSGDGIVFRGRMGPWYSPRDRQFHLDRRAAQEVLEGTLRTYREQEGKPLTEVFLHSRSEISDEEFAGYRAACPKHVKLVGVRVRTERSGPRLFRNGAMPVQRGSFWALNDRTGFLFASGFKARLGTYDGWETPAPLRIDIQHGDADVRQVAQDILGLTKLNYNACTMGDSQPVTVGFSDAVGEILVANPTVLTPKPQFKFYI